MSKVKKSTFPYFKLVNNEFIKVSKEEKQIFDNIIEAISVKSMGKQLFRGENAIDLYNNLRGATEEKYENLEENNLKRFTELIFLFGSKAKHYLEQKQPDIEKRDYLKSIDDISNHTFNFIFDKINRIVKAKSSDTIIGKYKKSEKHFFKYFKDLKNKIEFVSELSTFTEKDKTRIRDYYLYFLHTLGEDGISNDSFFKSTSLSYDKAKGFSKGLILYGWVVKPYDDFSVSKMTFRNLRNLIEKKELPKYGKEIYPREKEVSLKGGFLPCYLLGYEDLVKERFVINSHFSGQNLELLKTNPSIIEFLIKNVPMVEQNLELLKTDSSVIEFIIKYDSIIDCILNQYFELLTADLPVIEFIIKYGFPIDQSMFNQKITKTKFGRSFWRSNKGVYGDTVHNRSNQRSETISTIKQ